MAPIALGLARGRPGPGRPSAAGAGRAPHPRLHPVRRPRRGALRRSRAQPRAGAVRPQPRARTGRRHAAQLVRAAARLDADRGEHDQLVARRRASPASPTSGSDDCQISGGPQIGDGVRLIANLVPEQATDAQIVGNGIFDLAGAGLRIEGTLGALLVKRNVIRRCGQAGITTTADGDDPPRRDRQQRRRGDRRRRRPAGRRRHPADPGAAGQIEGNAVRAVGTAGAEGHLFAGIAVQGVGTVAVADNAVTEIGPMRRGARGRHPRPAALLRLRSAATGSSAAPRSQRHADRLVRDRDRPPRDRRPGGHRRPRTVPGRAAPPRCPGRAPAWPSPWSTRYYAISRASFLAVARTGRTSSP